MKTYTPVFITTIFRLLLASFMTLIFPINASAWDNKGVHNVTINRVVTLQSGEFYVVTDSDLCDGGRNPVGFVYPGNNLNDGKTSWTQAGSDMILSVALSARLSGHKVTIYADDSGSLWGCRMGAISLD